MLIEFSVENYLSFRERQTLSMVAAPRLHKRENTFKPELDGEKFPNLLKVAVIYGANASGKSNLLKGLDLITKLAKRNAGSANTALPVSPFRFDAALRDQPSQFEVHFLHKKIRYQLELRLTAERITKERLVCFLKGGEALLYERIHTNDGDQYDFGKALEGGRDLFEIWRNLTPPKLLFIAQAVANSNENLKQLREPFEWLTWGVMSLLEGMKEHTEFALSFAVDNPFFQEQIASFLRDIDVPVFNIETEATLRDKSGAVKKAGATFVHRTQLGDARIALSEESEGTKNLIGFYPHWFLKGGESISTRVLSVDELDSSLHPLIVAALVEKHIQSGAASQLIFTTHDTHLLNTKILRRDQIWITDRDVNGATQLRSIHEFEGRETEDVEKRYFEGRYRGLPFLKKS